MNNVKKYFCTSCLFKCINNVLVYYNISLFGNFYYVYINNIFNDLIFSSQQLTINIKCYNKCIRI